MRETYTDTPWKGLMAADGAGGGAGSEETGNATGTEGTASTEQPKSFDDVLNGNKEYQAEFDRRITQALEKQKGKMDKDYEARLQAQKTEAEKLAKMNAEQKAQYERERFDAELKEREASITRRELRAEVLNQLGEKNLPKKLADLVDYSNAEACEKSLQSVTESFQEAVKAGVADATKGGVPPKKAPETGGTFTPDQLKGMSAAEINANWDAVQESLKAQK